MLGIEWSSLKSESKYYTIRTNKSVNIVLFIVKGHLCYASYVNSSLQNYGVFPSRSCEFM